MPGAASILHADLDAFYASVEVRDNPRLVGLPVAVGGGVVLSATYEARRFGVEAPLTGSEARRRCPGLVIVPPRFEAYVAASRTVMEILESYTPEVEPISIDEAFLDVSGSLQLFGSPEQIGAAIRAAVRSRVGLPISVGCATTKHLAKIASRVAKPEGLLVVPPGEEQSFLDPLPIRLVWGVGPVGQERLARYGVATIGDLRRLPPETLASWMGEHWGSHLWALANNLDPRPVTRGTRARSVGAQSAGPATDPDRRHSTLLALADRIGSRLRRKALAGRRVTVRVRLDDMTALTRARVLPGAIAETTSIFRTAVELTDTLIAERAPGRGITLVGIAVSLLENAPHLQLRLPLAATGERGDETVAGSPQHLRLHELDAAVDRARERFGTRTVIRAALLADEPEERSPMQAMGERLRHPGRGEPEPDHLVP
jgi:DNA polymerase-4